MGLFTCNLRYPFKIKKAILLYKIVFKQIVFTFSLHRIQSKWTFSCLGWHRSASHC